MTPDGTVTVTADRLPGRISPFQYGQLFEYLCDLVPSLYGELLDDPGFEGIVPCAARFLPGADPQRRPWRLTGAARRGAFARDARAPYAGTRCARLTLRGDDPDPVGVAQAGIAVDAGARYRFAVSARGSRLAAGVTVRLVAAGRVLAARRFDAVGTDWSRLSAELRAEDDADDATLEIVTRGPGTLWLDASSLTGADTVAGWRPDVVAALRGLQPGMLRFGGTTIRKHFEWKDGAVPPDRRAPFSDAGGSTQPGNVGVDEFLDLCRAVGAEPLMCVRFSDRRPADAAELVEYCNGSAAGGWGARRAALGRPAPRGVRYWQVGNEVRGRAYERDLPAFCRAMLAADPSIRLLSSYPSAGVLAGAGQYLSHTCPHLYHAADLERSAAELRDLQALVAGHAPRPGVRAAITEWNASNPGWGPGRAELMTLGNALACARFHNLLHRNAALVDIACRSNLADSFCGGAIETHTRGLIRRPVYFVQQLYATLGGSVPLACTAPADAPDVSAALTDDGEDLILYVVNDQPRERRCTIDVTEVMPDPRTADAWQLLDTREAGSADAMNTLDDPDRVRSLIMPVTSVGPVLDCELPPLTVTALRLSGMDEDELDDGSDLDEDEEDGYAHPYGSGANGRE